MAPALPALACSPALMEVTGQPITGEGCALFWAVDQINGVGISPAEALAGGFAIQDTVNGNACYSALSTVLADCTSGQVLVLGEDRFDLMAQVNGPKIEALRSRLAGLADAGKLTLAGAEAEAKSLGFDQISHAAIADGLTMGGHDFPLGCGCKTLFPELAGGG